MPDPTPKRPPGRPVGWRKPEAGNWHRLNITVTPEVYAWLKNQPRGTPGDILEEAYKARQS